MTRPSCCFAEHRWVDSPRPVADLPYCSSIHLMTSPKSTSSPIRPRLKWLALQAVLVPVLLLLGALLIEAAFAIPTNQYHAEYGPVPAGLSRCDAISLPGKRGISPRCATLGSMETNPGGLAALGLGIAASVLLLILSARPGRGLRFGRKRDAG